MKRGGPLKRSGIQRKSPLVPKTPMKRASELAQRAVKAKRTKVTPEERKARQLVAARSNGVCERCASAPATNWHHRKPRSQGGLWCASNGLALCGSGTTGCHGWIESHREDARKRGWLVRRNDDPVKTPVWLYGREWVFLAADGSIEQAPEEAA